VDLPGCRCACGAREKGSWDHDGDDDDDDDDDDGGGVLLIVGGIRRCMYPRSCATMCLLEEVVRCMTSKSRFIERLAAKSPSSEGVSSHITGILICYSHTSIRGLSVACQEFSISATYGNSFVVVFPERLNLVAGKSSI